MIHLTIKTRSRLTSILQRLDEATLNFKLENFRAYSKGATTDEAKVVATTALTNGGVSKTTSDGGAVSKTVTSKSVAKTTSSATSSSGGQTTVSSTSSTGGSAKPTATTNTIVLGTRQTSRPAGSSNGDPGNIHMGSHTHTVFIPNHQHSFSVSVPSHSHTVSVKVPSHSHSVSITIPSHSHDVSYNVPAHSHKIDISGHSHIVNVTVPSHGHNIVHGIYDYEKLALCEIYIDGTLVLDNVGGDRNLNIAQYIKRNTSGSYGGTHTIEVRSKSTTSNPQGLGRANVSIFISGFVSF